MSHHDGSRSLLTEVTILTMLACLIRVAAFILTVDAPGDGPTKAIIAYQWAKEPSVGLYGHWLPGYLYLTGLVSTIIPIPWIALRLLNVVIGVATVPVFYMAVAPVFGPVVAIIGAALITMFPLHVELSASSLTEVSVVFEILLGVNFLRLATEPGARRRGSFTTIAIGCFVLASMTRYEIWVLLPLFPFYYWLRTKAWRTVLGMAGLLFASPVAWMIVKHFVEGDALLGFATAIDDRTSDNSYVGLIGGAEIFYTEFLSRLGWILLLLLMLGLIIEIRSFIVRRLSTERILFLFVILASLGTMLACAVFRGKTIYDRFLLFSYIFSMAIVAIPIGAYLRNVALSRLWGAIFLAITYTVGSALWTGRVEAHWLTFTKADPIIRLGEWLSKSSWRNQPVISTLMDWQLTYLPYFFPAFATKIMIVSPWIDDAGLREWMRTVRPPIFVTRHGDEADVERFSKVTGIKIDRGRVIYRDGGMEVYALANAP